MGRNMSVHQLSFKHKLAAMLVHRLSYMHMLMHSFLLLKHTYSKLTLLQ